MTRASPTSLEAAITRWIAAQSGARKTPAVLGVSGAQGVGKSTILSKIQQSAAGKVVVLSLDDVYLTRADRRVLAQSVHPLFETRGPPGTHDLALLEETLSALRDGEAPALLPRFDKAVDDRVDRSAWPRSSVRPDVIILEGWMIGVHPDASAAHADPLNPVEAEDENGAWRAYQEAQLAGPMPSCGTSLTLSVI